MTLRLPNFCRHFVPFSGQFLTIVGALLLLSTPECHALTGTEWRAQHFGNGENIGAGEDNADPDGDLIPNILEYCLNQDPSKRNARWGTGEANGSAISVTYVRRKAAFNEANFRYLWATELAGPWSSVGVTESILSDDGTFQTCKASVSTSGVRKFMKLEVSRVAPPGGVTVEQVSSSELRLVWTYGGTPATGFKFERRVSGNGSAFGPAVSAPVGNRTHLDGALTPATTYVYEIWAENNGASSIRVQARNTTPTSNVLVPNAPSNVLVSSLSTTSLKVQWSDHSSNETGFRIERRQSGTSNYAQVSDVPANSAANPVTFTDSGLLSGTKYYYRIAALNGTTASAFTDPAVAGAFNFTVPSAPTGFVVSNAGSTQVALAWTDSFTSETGYLMERRKSGTPEWLVVGQPAADSTSFQDTGLTGSSTYYYRLYVTNPGGTSAAVQVTATTGSSNGVRPTWWPQPPWPLVLPDEAGRFVKDGLIGFINNGPVIARFYETAQGTILWAESFEGRGLDPGPYTTARGFGIGQGTGFRPSWWAGGAITGDDKWFFADGDPQTGWRPSMVIFQTFNNGEVIRDPDGTVHTINGGFVMTRVDNGIKWAESFEGQVYSPTKTYLRNTGTGFRPYWWLESGGMLWRNVGQFSATDPR